MIRFHVGKNPSSKPICDAHTPSRRPAPPRCLALLPGLAPTEPLATRQLALQASGHLPQCRPGLLQGPGLPSTCLALILSWGQWGQLSAACASEPSAGPSPPATACLMASSPGSPTSQGQGPSPAAPPYTRRGLRPGPSRPPLQGSGWRPKQAPSPRKPRSSSQPGTPPLRLLRAPPRCRGWRPRARGLGGGPAPGAPESIMASGHWLLVMRPMMAPPDPTQPRAPARASCGGQAGASRWRCAARGHLPPRRSGAPTADTRGEPPAGAQSASGRQCPKWTDEAQGVTCNADDGPLGGVQHAPIAPGAPSASPGPLCLPQVPGQCVPRAGRAAASVGIFSHRPPLVVLA